MKLKTTVLAAACSVLASSAAAFAIPVGPPQGITPEQTETSVSKVGERESKEWGARMTAGDTLLVDARLGHASMRTSSRGETFLLAQVTASDEESSKLLVPPLNLAVVIDRSGSMKGERIANAMNAAIAALERMRDGDSITVVSFDTRAEVVVPPTRVSARERSSIEAKIRSIRLGGDTCISCGLEEGMRQLASASLGTERIDRMILLSDGATNSGVRDVAGLRGMASRMHGRGVTISTIGVDVDYDEKVMAAIANEANGRHYFVANASGLTPVFSREFDDLLASVAKEAELELELAPGVEVLEVFDRTFRREGKKLVIPFGTFSAKQEKTMLVKLRVPTDREGSQSVADLRLTFRDLVRKSDGVCSGNLAVQVSSNEVAQELDPFVATRLERSRTARTLTEANELFEAGKATEARAKLAERKADLKKSESSALAFASVAPAAAPRRAARTIDRDFADQAAAVDEAAQRFAPPPPSVSRGAEGRAAGPSREEKAQVRANQEKASVFNF